MPARCFTNRPRVSGPGWLVARARRVSACADKHAHPSRGAAEAHLRALVRLYGDTVTVVPYQCQVCGQWHLGRDPWRSHA